MSSPPNYQKMYYCTGFGEISYYIFTVLQPVASTSAKSHTAFGQVQHNCFYLFWFKAAISTIFKVKMTSQQKDYPLLFRSSLMCPLCSSKVSNMKNKFQERWTRRVCDQNVQISSYPQAGIPIFFLSLSLSLLFLFCFVLLHLFTLKMQLQK